MAVIAITKDRLFNPLREMMHTVIERLFYKERYDFYDVVQRISRGLINKLNIEEIYSFIGEVISDTLGHKEIYILSSSAGDYFKVIYKKDREKGETPRDALPNLRINKDSGLLRFFNRTKEIFILGRGDMAGDEFEEIRNEFVQLKAEIAVPVFVDDKLFHIMILAGGPSRDMPSLKDAILLNTMSNQISIAVKSAQLYSEKLLSERFVSLGMMCATFAHEIRNPLTSLRTFAELLPEKYNDPDFRMTFKKVILYDIGRINTLLNELLTLSEIQEKKRVAFNLIEMIDEVVDYVEGMPEPRRKGIVIHKNYNKDINLKIKGERERLKQAFINIMNNGCEAMDKGGVLTVGIISSGKDVNISISNSGEGIDIKDIDRIFEPFYTTKERGMGLGLFICKKTIEEHAGNIKVESNQKDGTTFTITLPHI